MVYGLCADLHLHGWSAFSSVNADGMNTRLAGLHAEIMRCAQEVHEAGGSTVVFAGDIFHVRGSVSPTVLNSTIDCLAMAHKTFGTHFMIMPGNHDLEGKESTRLSSAVTALASGHVRVIDGRSDEAQFCMIPWIENLGELMRAINSTHSSRENRDLIIHAPVNGVIKGLPLTGLYAEKLADYAFRRVFAGHYHNHKKLHEGADLGSYHTSDVYSIGALAHHSWSDVGSKAGFLLVHDDRVEWRKSHLPEFIDLSQLTDLAPEDIPLVVDGNFVRVKVTVTKSKDVENARKELLDMGAKAVLVEALPKPPARAGTEHITIKSGASLEASVIGFIAAEFSDKTEPERNLIHAGAIAVLASVDATGVLA